LLFQQPSAFDTAVVGARSNTGSMFAASAWLIFCVRGSEIAAPILVAGFSMFGSFGIYQACREAYPEGSSLRLFTATVLFPSVAFWTATLHKEAFCIVGIGLIFSAWRLLRHGSLLRGTILAVIGTTVILIFRAPAFPPIVLGLGAHFIVERLGKARSTEKLILGPVYLGLGLVAVALGMVLVSRGDEAARLGPQCGWLFV
jgi:hypothetical protein